MQANTLQARNIIRDVAREMSITLRDQTFTDRGFSTSQIPANERYICLGVYMRTDTEALINAINARFREQGYSTVATCKSRYIRARCSFDR
jgi:hypothetical protein